MVLGRFAIDDSLQRMLNVEESLVSSSLEQKNRVLKKSKARISVKQIVRTLIIDNSIH